MNDLDDGMEEVLQEFLAESAEGLDQFDQDMVDLEQNPGCSDLISSVFRTIHTIKGTSGFLALSQLESVTHVGESLLSLLREGKLGLTPEITTALLQMGDAVRRILGFVESGDGEGPDEDAELRARLEELARGESPSSASAPDEAPAESPAAQSNGQGSTDAASTDDVPVATPSGDGPAVGAQGGGDSGSDQPATGHVADASIRVGVGLLDSLMNLVGELVLARNQVLQFTATEESSGLTATSQRLNLITTELQEGVMKTRMQPIGNVWGKFPRVVRDLATACGKKVRIDMEGRETDLDRTIIEAIRDPLTHVIRNSVDHGIESPEVRRQNGKPEEGQIQLRAYHEGGQVNIEIIDDGGGIDAQQIRDKAVERGLITSEKAASLSERECVNLIFAAGFSTAAAVTNVSGRGVGMDVVRTNIEKIGGAVDIKSTVGEGTSIRIKIPLTLAIIPALIVRSGGNSYAIPQVSLLELVRLEGEEARTRIDSIHGTPVYRLRGNLLPLAYLSKELGHRSDGLCQGSPDERADIQDFDDLQGLNIVVLQADDRQFGLVVEEILDTEEIVVKPLGKQLKGIGTFAGTTIMGDGSVALILDVLGVAQRAHVVSQEGSRGAASEVTASQGQSADLETLLLIKMGQSGRAAIPISAVARLEEFPSSTIEYASGSEVVQYRGDIMSLVRLSEALGFESNPADASSLQVVVYSCDDKNVGLVVDCILDIVEQEVTIERSQSGVGVRGAAVIQGNVTDVLDLESVIRDQIPGLATDSEQNTEVLAHV